ncbi:MAG: hypothetical protein H6741_16715 [Alphaproteobacteria bacterium]|nr:hypothetical protein [Alphaproteobacteria bacterium]MCB9794358.1 hypothetical protein [Alphaproteobacteria bacterium]
MPQPISFDVHVLFQPPGLPLARARRAALVAWAAEQGIPLLYDKLWEAPVGPWPQPMWEVQVPAAAHAEAVLGWLAGEAPEASVFVHPNSAPQSPEQARIDHFELGRWAQGEGTPLRDVWVERGLVQR